MSESTLAQSADNSSFLPNSKLQFAWDSTSLGALKTCPRYYYYTIVEGWTSRHLNVHLAFGLHYHAALEYYDHRRCEGASHDEALCGAVRQALTSTWNEKEGHPWESDDPNKNRWTLIRSVVWYLDQFGESDPLRTLTLASGKPAVEVSFRLELEYKTAEGQPYFYCGHQDRIVELEGKTYILDRKTSKHQLDERFFSSFSPHNQFTGYIFAGKVLSPSKIEGMIVDAAQIAGTFTRFARQEIPISEFRLAEWHKDLGFWLKINEGFAKADYWPMNESSCGNYGGCPFRQICSKGNEKVRNDWLKAQFVKRVWDPLQVRGDI